MKTNKKVAPKTGILFILDESGSMQPHREAVIRGFDEFIHGQKLEDKKNKNTLTLTVFGTQYTPSNTKICYTKKVKDVGSIRGSYRPGGSTPLWDAVGDTITATSTDENERVLCVIFTDGDENASRRWRKDQIRDLIKRKTDEGNWTFVFLGTGAHVWTTVDELHIPRTNTMVYADTYAGRASAMRGTSMSASVYTASTALQTDRFFTTDMSGVSTTTVKDKLDDISNVVDIFTVTAECEIKKFCEQKTKLPYTKGNAFYQLTKPEIIQGNKFIMVMEKGKKPVYAGPEARKILGLPNYDLKVVPGNHANYDIFVQSGSTNRKLVRGSKLIYRKV